MTPPTHGVWPCSSAEYHADKSADSFSSLKLFAESPLKYYRTRIKGDLERDKPSKEMRIGTLTHLMVLEPDGMEMHRCNASFNRKTKVGRDAYQAACDEGWHIYSDEEWQTAEACAAAVKASDVWQGLDHASAVFERAICWQGDIPLKAKKDVWLPINGGSVLDIKAIGDLDLSPRHIRWLVRDREYHTQAALYLDGVKAVYGMEAVWYWIFVSTKSPHEVAVYSLEPHPETGEENPLITEGKATLAKWIKDRVECEQRGWRRNEDLITRLGAWEKT